MKFSRLFPIALLLLSFSLGANSAQAGDSQSPLRCGTHHRSSQYTVAPTRLTVAPRRIQITRIERQTYTVMVVGRIWGSKIDGLRLKRQPATEPKRTFMASLTAVIRPMRSFWNNWLADKKWWASLFLGLIAAFLTFRKWLKSRRLKLRQEELQANAEVAQIREGEEREKRHQAEVKTARLQGEVRAARAEGELAGFKDGLNQGKELAAPAQDCECSQGTKWTPGALEKLGAFLEQLSANRDSFQGKVFEITVAPNISIHGGNAHVESSPSASAESQPFFSGNDGQRMESVLPPVQSADVEVPIRHVMGCLKTHPTTCTCNACKSGAWCVCSNCQAEKPQQHPDTIETEAFVPPVEKQEIPDYEKFHQPAQCKERPQDMEYSSSGKAFCLICGRRKK